MALTVCSVTKVFMGRAVKGAVCPSVFLELIHHQNTFTNLLLTINLIKGCDNMTLLGFIASVYGHNL